MKELKGSKTYDNLITAFAGESQARNKYTFFAIFSSFSRFFLKLLVVLLSFLVELCIFCKKC